jgi:hypothetical protein
MAGVRVRFVSTRVACSRGRIMIINVPCAPRARHDDTVPLRGGCADARCLCLRCLCLVYRAAFVLCTVRGPDRGCVRASPFLPPFPLPLPLPPSPPLSLSPSSPLPLPLALSLYLTQLFGLASDPHTPVVSLSGVRAHLECTSSHRGRGVRSEEEPRHAKAQEKWGVKCGPEMHT